MCGGTEDTWRGRGLESQYSRDEAKVSLKHWLSYEYGLGVLIDCKAMAEVMGLNSLLSGCVS